MTTHSYKNLWTALAFLLVVFVFPCVHSCRHDDLIPFCELHPDQCYKIDEVKEFLYFKDGSYWVYEEETTGELDSMYVIGSENYPNSYYFSTTIHSQLDSYDYEYWSILGTGCPDTGLVQDGLRCTHIKKLKGKPGDFVSETYVFFYWAEKGDFMTNWVYQHPDNAVLVKEVLSTYDLSGETYQDVYVVEEEYDASENKQHTMHYYARNHGLVRKELLDSGEVWNLVRYNLVQ